MLKENSTFKIPMSLLVLDFIGAILLGVGLAEWFADTGLVPERFLFENYYIAMVICGGLFMLPLILHILKKSAVRRLQH
ncbi:MAG: chemotaxis protein [Gammaproteobacteria bacterium]